MPYTKCMNMQTDFGVRFLYNDIYHQTKVLTSIERGLYTCKSFCFAVAFISNSGFTALANTLKELESKGIEGKILTTDYLFFSHPDALTKLANLSNVTLRLYRVHGPIGYHPKFYSFESDEKIDFIIGSSNLTQSALCTNIEWNTQFTTTKDGVLSNTILSEFNRLWDSEYSYDYLDIQTEYEEQYYAHLRPKQKVEVEYKPKDYKPNSMQKAFMNNLHALRSHGAKRALLISATGTGKTYASAFALKNEGFKKALFIVHRELIAKQALKTYSNIFPNKKLGLLSGNSKDYDADILFATMAMMSKEDVLQQFPKDTFDWICIDEAHRAGSKSYERIMNYFEPNFWLGMTASPNRTDGFDIFELFDHNIAYEIQLQTALDEDLLCPFHYFGISEIEIDGKTMDDQTSLRNFAYLVSEQRVNYILEQSNFFGHSGKRVKGLIFCSRKQEAVELSRQFNERGYFTSVLTGESGEKQREKCIDRLTKDIPLNQIKEHKQNIENGVVEDEYDFLDYIFTIDVFNEGVDIPEINQVLLLRSTQSPIIFIQQLGRGLRKAEDKDYVVILDFIGNYQNNYMIPIALSGDYSYNKDSMRRYVSEGSRVIPGCSTIHFDQISKKRIFASIDTAKTNAVRLLRDAFEEVKYRLGHIPTIQEFQEYGSMDIKKYFLKFKSYPDFLIKYYPKEYTSRFNASELNILRFLSTVVVNTKRVHEIALLKALLEKESISALEYDNRIRQYHGSLSPLVERSVLRNLRNEFKPTNEDTILVKKEGDHYQLEDRFSKLLSNPAFYQCVMEVIEYGVSDFQKNYSHPYKNTNFQLYQKYTYEDVCRLLNWDKYFNAQNIGGYFYHKETKTLPVFINYVKSEDAIAYEDRFINNQELIALSKHPRKIDSSDADHFYKRTESDKDNLILLFVRKNKDDNEAKEFYFLGEMHAQGEPKPVYMEKSKDNAFEIHYQLENPVRDDIYDYIVGDIV